MDNSDVRSLILCSNSKAIIEKRRVFHILVALFINCYK